MTLSQRIPFFRRTLFRRLSRLKKFARHLPLRPFFRQSILTALIAVQSGGPVVFAQGRGIIPEGPQKYREHQDAFKSPPPYREVQGNGLPQQRVFNGPQMPERQNPLLRQTNYQTPPPNVPLPPLPEYQLPQRNGSQHQEAAGSIQFNFNSAPWDLVLSKFAEQNDLSLQMGQPIPGTFTYYDQRAYSPVQALDIINDYLLPQGYLAIRSGTSLVVIRTTDDVPLNLVPMIQASELESLGRNSLASIAIPIHSGIPASAAQEVEQILSPLGSVSPLTSSQRILVTDTGGNLRRIYQLLVEGMRANSDLPTFVYQLRNTSAEEVTKAINDFISESGGSSTPTPGGRPNAAQSLSGGQVVAELSTNQLLVRGTELQLEKIRNIIQEIDRAPRQVVIQALLVEVELGNTDELGVEIGIQDSVLFDRSVIDDILTISRTITNPNGTQTTDQQIISQSATPGFNFNSQPLGNNVAISPSTIGTQSLSTFGVGRSNDQLGFGGLVLSASSESISVLIRALAENHHVDILSRPQIRTLDNHEAMIQIGKQVPVVDGVAVTAVGSANPVIRQDNSGIILTVTPRISPEGLVLIDVNAEKSAFNLSPGSGVPIFTDATNGNVIEAPVKDITTAHTSVSVQNGETIVLGGMITRDSITVNRKVPWLGDIPWVGTAFRYDFDQTSRKELLIFLTPHVLSSPDDALRFKHEEIGRLSMPFEEAEMLHGPIIENRAGGPSVEFQPYRELQPVPPVDYRSPLEMNATPNQGVSPNLPPMHQSNAQSASSNQTGNRWQAFPNSRKIPYSGFSNRKTVDSAVTPASGEASSQSVQSSEVQQAILETQQAKAPQKKKRGFPFNLKK